MMLGCVHNVSYQWPWHSHLMLFIGETEFIEPILIICLCSLCSRTSRKGHVNIVQKNVFNAKSNHMYTEMSF